ncbi:MAG TPA: aldehyde dehydrogenase family protein, partial [Vicinamibacteria bacterium]
MDWAPVLEAQRRYFESGATLLYEFRRRQLETLARLLRENEARIEEALAADLGKSPFEVYAS